MRWLLPFLLLVLLALLVLAIPLFLVELTEGLGKTEQIFSLLRLYLMTCAFVGALWALYLKDTRLRANSDNVLVALVVFVLATSFLVLAMLVAQLSAPRSAVSSITGTSLPSLTIARFIAFISLEVYLFSFLTLLFTVFMQSYNQLYNLRTDKVVKYFKPVRWLRKQIGPHKRYEYQQEQRCICEQFPLTDYFESTEDLKKLKDGASILITGRLTDSVIAETLKWMLDRMKHNETANYAVADRHPYEIWKLLESQGFNDDRRRDLVLIDCYSPSFAFTDDIHEETDRKLQDQGVAMVKAKTFAGLHTASNKAFNIIKAREQEKKKNVRRPMVMIYAHISALCEFESTEQFRVFWRHVLPSERSYGMLTFILEDELAGDDILHPLRRLVDFELSASKGKNGECEFQRVK